MPLKTEALRSLQRKLCKRSGTFTVLFFGGIWKSQRPKSDLLEAATEVERKAHETLDVGSLSWKRQALQDILYRALKLGCEHVSNHGISGASLSDVLFVQCDGFDQFCMTWVIKRVSKHPEIWRSSLSNGWETLYIYIWTLRFNSSHSWNQSRKRRRKLSRERSWILRYQTFLWDVDHSVPRLVNDIDITSWLLCYYTSSVF